MNVQKSVIPYTNGYTAVTFGRGIYLALGHGVYATSEDGRVWVDQGYSRFNINENNLVFGNGIFIALDEFGYLYINDHDWSESTFTGSFSRICFGNGIFVAIDHQGNSAISEDGQNWTSGTIASHTWNGLAYGNGVYVAASGDGYLASSQDGLNWTYVQTYDDFRGVSFGNGRFVASGYPTYVKSFVSITGTITYCQPNPFIDNQVWSVAYGNGVFVAVGLSGYSATSTDGIIWTPLSNTLRGTYPITFGDGGFVCIGTDQTEFYYLYANTWNFANFAGYLGLSLSYSFRDESVLVVVPNCTFRSTDGLNWNNGPSELFKFASFGETAIGYGYLCVSPSGKLVYSNSDGRFYDIGPYPYPSNWNPTCVTNINNTFVIGSSDGTIIYVPIQDNSGTYTWNLSLVYSSFPWSACCNNDGRVVFVSSDGFRVYSDNNGQSFSPDNGPYDNFVSIASNGDFIVAISNSNAFVTNDETDFGRPYALPGNTFKSITYNDFFVAVGTGVAALSQDGYSWTSFDLGTKDWISVTPFVNRKQFIALAYDASISIFSYDFQYGYTYQFTVTRQNYVTFNQPYPGYLPSYCDLQVTEYAPPAFVEFQQGFDLFISVPLEVGSNVSLTFIEPQTFTIPSNCLANYNTSVYSFKPDFSGICLVSTSRGTYTVSLSYDYYNHIHWTSSTFPYIPFVYQAFFSKYLEPTSTIYGLFNASDTKTTGLTLSQDPVSKQDTIVSNNNSLSHRIQRINQNLYQNYNGSVIVGLTATVSNGTDYIGIIGSFNSQTDPPPLNVNPVTSLDCVTFSSDGNAYVNGTLFSNTCPTWTTGDNITLAQDAANSGILIYGVNNIQPISPVVPFPNVTPGSKVTYQYFFVSPAFGSTYTFNGYPINPDGYTQLLPWGLNFGAEVGTPVSITSQSIGVKWPDYTPGNSYSIAVTDTDTGRSLQTIHDVNSSYTVINDLQPSTTYNLALYNSNEEMTYPLLLGVRTTEQLKVIQTTVTDYTNITLPTSDLWTVATPRLIAINRLILKHDNTHYPIKSYTLTSSEINYSETFPYQGQNFSYENHSINYSLGTQIPIDFIPDNLTFTLSYNTTYGKTVPAYGLSNFSATFVFYSVN